MTDSKAMATQKMQAKLAAASKWLASMPEHEDVFSLLFLRMLTTNELNDDDANVLIQHVQQAMHGLVMVDMVARGMAVGMFAQENGKRVFAIHQVAFRPRKAKKS